MNIGGGEAADQLVRMMLASGEVAVRLSGSALKNVLALTLALAKDHKKIYGKVNLGRMLRETRDLRQFPMTPEQYRQFHKLAKRQKLLYSSIRDRDGRGRLIDVILPVTELDRANQIFGRMLYQEPTRREEQPPQQEREMPAKERAGAPQERQEPGKEQQQGEKPQARQMPPVGQSQAGPPKKDFRSGRDSHVTKISSSISRESGTTRMTPERPSVEGRLKAYRAQIKQQSVPARQRIKSKVREK